VVVVQENIGSSNSKSRTSKQPGLGGMRDPSAALDFVICLPATLAESQTSVCGTLVAPRPACSSQGALQNSESKDAGPADTNGRPSCLERSHAACTYPLLLGERYCILPARHFSYLFVLQACQLPAPHRQRAQPSTHHARRRQRFDLQGGAVVEGCPSVSESAGMLGSWLAAAAQSIAPACFAQVGTEQAKQGEQAAISQHLPPLARI
jgi:hypothetical protein